MEAFLQLDSLTALLTLTFMEIVLGIDNIIFIAILVGRLPIEKQNKTRNIGLVLALVMRLGLLFSISWVMSLTDPLFTVFSKAFSGRDMILLVGGLFLIGKSTFEIHHKLEGDTEERVGAGAVSQKKNMALWILMQIIVLDIVFSLDSVITAVGMAKEISIMVAAMVIAMIVMLLVAKRISEFVSEHPTIKILALSFLILIGVMLVAEGMGQHISKGYIYFAMFFSLFVEFLNMKYRKTKKAEY